ncbi:hypothetical protein GYMLUDRAFT_1023314 [Collybiopsis luxurians FD-317 M1]|nr:hypothetical protein GYMLUDRAFT_1023314 [Collybiopsis luxurians FD-317 M1]
MSVHFLKLGERNYKVEDFTELCVTLWETMKVRGEYASWILDMHSFGVLWWSTRLTFNLHTIQ